MAWQVALVLDTETHVSALLGMMPVWAQTSPKRKEAASQLRASWDEAWSPDPAFTLWTNPPSEDLIDEVFAEIPTVEMHHPELACLRIFGLIETERLTEALKEFGYRPVAGTTFPGLAFARSVEELPDVRELILDAKNWRSSDDFYNDFFRAVGAPEWHGRNFNALIDSIQTGRINKIEVPYKIIIRGFSLEDGELGKFFNDFADLVRDLQSNGCPVSLQSG